jgi:PEP-CTERM motif
MKSILLIAAATATLAAATAGHAAQFVTNGEFTNLTNGLGELSFNTQAVGWSTTGYNFVMTQADLGSSGSYGGTTLWDSANYNPGPTGDIGSYYSTTIFANPVGNTWNGLAKGAGNFVALDGDFGTSPLTQTITGLTVGDTYHLSFSYAFAQQTGFDGDTVQSLTETLGGQTFVSDNVTLPSHGFSGWNTYGATITANATTETLSFLATGNLPVPPFALVSNVSLTGGVPEPAAWALMIVGVGMVGSASRRRRAAVAITA